METIKDVVSITGIDYELGEITGIEVVDFLNEDPKRLEQYRAAGLQNFARSELSGTELALRSVKKTLAKSQVDPATIELCIYAGESWGRDEVIGPDAVNSMLVKSGLNNAYPFGIALSQCANFITALKVGSMAIKSGEVKTVLIVSVDKAPAKNGGRKMNPELSIRSDGAVSCIMRKDDSGDFLLRGIFQRNFPIQRTINDENEPAKFPLIKLNGIRKSTKALLTKHQLKPEDFSRAIMNNYNREITKMYLESCGFNADQGFYQNIARFAHAVAGDIMINAQSLEDRQLLQKNDLLFFMADSISSISVMFWEKI